MASVPNSEMGDDGEIRWQRQDNIVWLTLSRPHALNALTWTMYEQLEDDLGKVASDPSIRVLILRGDGGKALAAGTDIRQFVGFCGEDGVQYEARIDRIVRALEQLQIPTIAAVQGYAVGGGLILATACDLRYATPGSRFGAPMARTLGNCLSLENCRRLERALGAMRVKELVYTARMMHAEEALTGGYLSAIFEDAVFYDKVAEIASRIAAHAPLTMSSTKMALSVDHQADAARNYEDVVKTVYGSRDFAEGVQAYLEKRTPEWKGE